MTKVAPDAITKNPQQYDRKKSPLNLILKKTNIQNTQNQSDANLISKFSIS